MAVRLDIPRQKGAKKNVNKNGGPRLVSAFEDGTVENEGITMPQREQNGFTDTHSFYKFAYSNFRPTASPYYMSRPLDNSLLSSVNENHKKAALDVWTTILRYLGDLPEAYHPQYTPMFQSVRDVQLIRFNRLTSTMYLCRMQEGATYNEHQSNSAKPEPPRQTVHSFRRFIYGVLKKLRPKNKFTVAKLESGSDDLDESELSFVERPSTDMEKIHFVIGNGICTPQLKDEIFCQLCKQLNRNPNRPSRVRAWTLLTLVLGCLVPSKKLAKSLESFLDKAPPSHKNYCLHNLRRLRVGGTRYQPPTWLEVKMASSPSGEKVMSLPVTLMTGDVKMIPVDSATTVREFCSTVAQRIGLHDHFGFSVFIASRSKVESMGDGAGYILDTLSLYEQEADADTECPSEGPAEGEEQWKLFYRLETFTPWHHPSDNLLATHLAYHQIIAGVRYGEYSPITEETFVRLAAQQYYIDHGPELKQETLKSDLPSYLPECSPRAIAKWEKKVTSVFHDCDFFRDKRHPQTVVENVVEFAKNQWPLNFSRCYELMKGKAPSCVEKDRVIVALNWTGIYLMDDLEQILVEFSFPEILSISSNKYCQQSDTDSSPEGSEEDVLTLTSMTDECVFKSSYADDIRYLVQMFLDGLKERSQFAIATQTKEFSKNFSLYDSKLSIKIMSLNTPEKIRNRGCELTLMNLFCLEGEDAETLSFQTGDLITLKKPGDSTHMPGCLYGENSSTGHHGYLLKGSVCKIPTLTKPSSEIVDMLKEYINKIVD